jgi:hypothetical protein
MLTDIRSQPRSRRREPNDTVYAVGRVESVHSAMQAIRTTLAANVRTPGRGGCRVSSPRTRTPRRLRRGRLGILSASYRGPDP